MSENPEKQITTYLLSDILKEYYEGRLNLPDDGYIPVHISEERKAAGDKYIIWLSVVELKEYLEVHDIRKSFNDWILPNSIEYKDPNDRYNK